MNCAVVTEQINRTIRDLTAVQSFNIDLWSKHIDANEVDGNLRGEIDSKGHSFRRNNFALKVAIMALQEVDWGED